MKLVIGGKYNWRGQPEHLIYLGHNWSGNGYWHQFALVERPDKVWCEVLDSDLPSIEPTPALADMDLSSIELRATLYGLLTRKANKPWAVSKPRKPRQRDRNRQTAEKLALSNRAKRIEEAQK